MPFVSTTWILAVLTFSCKLSLQEIKFFCLPCIFFVLCRGFLFIFLVSFVRWLFTQVCSFILYFVYSRSGYKWSFCISDLNKYKPLPNSSPSPFQFSCFNSWSPLFLKYLKKSKHRFRKLIMGSFWTDAEFRRTHGMSVLWFCGHLDIAGQNTFPSPLYHTKIC